MKELLRSEFVHNIWVPYFYPVPEPEYIGYVHEICAINEDKTRKICDKIWLSIQIIFVNNMFVLFRIINNWITDDFVLHFTYCAWKPSKWHDALNLRIFEQCLYMSSFSTIMGNLVAMRFENEDKQFQEHICLGKHQFVSTSKLFSWEMFLENDKAAYGTRKKSVSDTTIGILRGWVSCMTISFSFC